MSCEISISEFGQRGADRAIRYIHGIARHFARAITRPISESVSEFGMDHTGVTARLKELLGEDDVAGFARECGIKDGTMRQYLKGSVPGLDKAAQIALAKRVNLKWLATGRGPRDSLPEEATFPAEEQAEPRGVRFMRIAGNNAQDQDMVLLPRLSIEASAGQGIVPAGEEIEEFLAFKAEFLRHLGVNPQNAHVLQIKGDSMYPTFRDYDVIIIDASLIEVREEGLYTIVYDDAVFAKRVQPLRDGSLRIVSDNKAAGYVDEIVPASERHTLKIVGRIRGVYRNL
ncbi:MAG: hypothetical protein K2X72_27650 [Reyranella sp.]|nr:hypothetical protein [Reyranella sp.]